MAYLSNATILEILAKIGPAGLRRAFRDTILPKLKTEFDDNATGLAAMPAAAGTLEASKLVQVDADKHIDELNMTKLSIGAAGAAVEVTATPAELNSLAGLALDDEMDALLNMEAELILLSGLTVGSGVLNALNANPGKCAVNVLNVTGAGEDTETVTIDGKVFELDTEDVENITGDVQVDVSGGSTVKAQGTLVIAEAEANAGGTFTIGDKVFTLVPDGTANADGEVDLGADEPEMKLNIVGAIKGIAPQAHNDASEWVTCPAEFTVDDLVLTAIIGGTNGNAVPTTEAFVGATNVFDAVTLGTTAAGVDPTAEEVIDALVTAINGEEVAYTAVKIGAAEMLISADAVGVVALTTVVQGAFDGTWAAATMYGGAAASGTKLVAQSRVPTANEVTNGNIHFAFDFAPAFVAVSIRATATGIPLAWNGATTITGNRVELDNAGDVDWDADDTISVLVYA